MRITATTTTRPHLTVDMVRQAMNGVVDESPAHIDPAPHDEYMPPRYLNDHGQPDCLVAKILVKLGFSAAVLMELDHEYRQGHWHPGVRIGESTHYSLCKIEGRALALLAYLQSGQEKGLNYGSIGLLAFEPVRFWQRKIDRKRRPWLYG